MHDLRVSTRRLLSVLKVTGALLPEASPRKLRRRLKTTLRLLGPLRDNQVKLSHVEDLLPSFSQLGDFHSWLLRRERKLIRQIGKRVRNVRIKGAEKSIQQARRRLRALPNNRMTARRHLRRLETTADVAFEGAVRRRRRIIPGRTDTIHRTRLAFKRFRYMREALKPLLGTPPAELKRMQAYQTRMGDIQDIEVLMEGLKKFAGAPDPTDPVAARSLDPVFAELRRRRAQAIRTFLASADEILSFRRTGSLPVKKGPALATAAAHSPSAASPTARLAILPRTHSAR